MDGDGYPDIVTSDSGESITIRRSKMGRTNMLGTVTQPFGGTITFDYTPIGITYDLPLCKRVLASVTVCPGMVGNGAASMKSTFGMMTATMTATRSAVSSDSEVTTRQLDTENKDALYRSVVSTYNNHSLYLRICRWLRYHRMPMVPWWRRRPIPTVWWKLTPTPTRCIRSWRRPSVRCMMPRATVSRQETYESDVYGNIIRYTSQTAADAVSSRGDLSPFVRLVYT